MEFANCLKRKKYHWIRRIFRDNKTPQTFFYKTTSTNAVANDVWSNNHSINTGFVSNSVDGGQVRPFAIVVAKSILLVETTTLEDDRIPHHD